MDRKQVAAAALILVMGLCAWLLHMPVQGDLPAEDEEAATRGPLTGVIIAIDPGHGGYDQGCQSDRGTLEAPLNLDVSLKLRARLTELGAHVVMTRETDDSLVDPAASGNRKRQDMSLREQIIKENEADIVLSIHMNYYTASGPSGALAYFAAGSEDGQALANAIQAAFHGADGRHNQSGRAGDYFMLGTCDAAALIECGFLSNPAEEALLLTDEYRQHIAEIIAQGTLSYWHPM